MASLRPVVAAAVVLLALTRVAAQTPSPESLEPQRDLPALETILDRMARVASIYVNRALSFTADERTEVVAYLRGHRDRYVAPRAVYLYVHTGRGRLDDRRIEKRRMTRLRRRLAAGDDVFDELRHAEDPLRGNDSVPAYVVRPYTWIMLFSRDVQPGYRYRLAEATREGLWISFEPAGPNPHPTDWYGDVLVEPETYQILRAQGFQHESLQEVEAARILREAVLDAPEAEVDRAFVEMHVRTEFGRRAHGLRLPSKVETRVYHHRVAQPLSGESDARLRAYTIVQKFTNYEFFGVDVTAWIGGPGKIVAP